MSKIEKTRPTALQRNEYLKSDKERFRDPSKAGAPRVWFDHDPYEPQVVPNPSGKSTTTVTVEYDGEPFETVSRTVDGPFVIASGARLLNAEMEPLFETMENIHFEGSGSAIVGAMAREPGVDGNIDIHVLVTLEGYPYAHFNVTNPFPGIGGGYGHVLTRAEDEPDKPKFRELTKYAEEKGGLSNTGDREIMSLLSSIPANDLPYPWQRIIIDAVRSRRLGTDKVVTLARYGYHEVLVLEHMEQRIAFAFQDHRLMEVSVDDEADEILKMLPKGGR